MARALGVIARPRRIMYVATDLHLGGGAEGMLARLVTATPSVADEVTVVSLLPGQSHADQIRTAGVSVVELGIDRGIVSGLYRLAKLIAQFRPDIVQGWMYHGDLAALIALVLSGRRKQTRLIWSIRCSDMDLRRYSARLRAVVKFCAFLSGRPDLITANSTAGLNSHLQLGYRPRRSEIVYNGIDVDAFKPDVAARAAVRRELGFADDTIVLAHVARVDAMKDHGNFLAAMAKLPDLHALMIGTGTEKLGGGPNIHRLGRRTDVARLLVAADITVSSSAFGEGFSNAIAEGMACGLPAVATDVGDVAQIIGDTGLIVKPRDPDALGAAILTLAREPSAARTERGRRARLRIVDNFSMANTVARHAELYASLL